MLLRLLLALSGVGLLGEASEKLGKRGHRLLYSGSPWSRFNGSEKLSRDCVSEAQPKSLFGVDDVTTMADAMLQVAIL